MSDRSVARCQEGSPFVLCSTDTTLVAVNYKGGKSNAYCLYYSAKHKRHGCKVEIATAVGGKHARFHCALVGAFPWNCQRPHHCQHTPSTRSPGTITRRFWQTGCTKEFASSLPPVVMVTPGLMPRCAMMVSSTIINRQQRE